MGDVSDSRWRLQWADLVGRDHRGRCLFKVSHLLPSAQQGSGCQISSEAASLLSSPFHTPSLLVTMARTSPTSSKTSSGGDRATGNGYKEMRNLKDLRLPMNPSQVSLFFLFSVF